MTLQQISEGTGVSEEELVALNRAKYPGIRAWHKLEAMTSIVVSEALEPSSKSSKSR